jgi:chorismate-pyruvate lyase
MTILMNVERCVFPENPTHAPLLRLLLAADGSTTRLCEAIAGGPVELLLVHQAVTHQVPQAVRDQLGGQAWLHRVTSLHANGRVMMDNLSYTRLDAVPDDFLAALNQGQAPIGHLLKPLFIKRVGVQMGQHVNPLLAEQLWAHVGCPDLSASRAYHIETPQGPLMLIFEAYRQAMVHLL